MSVCPVWHLTSPLCNIPTKSGNSRHICPHTALKHPKPPPHNVFYLQTPPWTLPRVQWHNRSVIFGLVFLALIISAHETEMQSGPNNKMPSSGRFGIKTSIWIQLLTICTHILKPAHCWCLQKIAAYITSCTILFTISQIQLIMMNLFGWFISYV